MKIPWHHTILMRRGRRPPPKPRGGGSRKAAAKGENGKWTPAPRKHVKHITLGRGAEQRRCMWYSDQYLAWLDRISECRSTRKGQSRVCTPVRVEPILCLISSSPGSDVV